MRDMLLVISNGVAIYSLLCVLTDVLTLVFTSRKPVGAVGMLINMLLLTVANQIRPMRDIIYYVMVVVSIINLKISVIQLLLGLTSCDDFK